MTKTKKSILIILLVLIILCIFRSKWPPFMRHWIGMYTLSEAMDTGSYGLICRVLEDASQDEHYDLKDLCEPKLEHMEIALQKEWREVMLLFLESKANPNPNQRNSKGYTLLDEAILNNSYKMCELLLDDTLDSGYTDRPVPINAKVNQKNKYENTALDELCKVSNEDMLDGEWEKRVQLLIEHGAEVSDNTRVLLNKSSHKDKITWINSLLQGKSKKKNIDFAKDDMEQIKQKWKNKTFTKEECYNLLKNLQIYGSTETIQLLLDDLQIQKYLDNNQKEELMEMAARDNPDVVTIYLEKSFQLLQEH